LAQVPEFLNVRILITGAGGFIGRACVAGFAAAGWQVRAVSRQPAPARPGVERVLSRDPGRADWTALLHGVDCVLHLAGVAHRPAASLAEYEDINVRLTGALARAAVASGVGHFVYLSSVAVHGRDRGDIDETMPLCPGDANGRSKALAEAALREIARDTPMHWTVVRPPLVYGSDAPGNFRRLAVLVRRGIPLPLAAATAPRSYIGIYNLVSALLCIVDNPKAAEKTYLVSDNDDLCTADLIRAMAQGVGRQARLWWLPAGLLSLGASLLGRSGDAERILGRLQIDTRAIRQELGWAPPIPAREGIVRAMADSADGLN
jgi:nucleoside-diphosphate-sugar epimerase